MENNINQCRECCRDISEEDSKKYKGYCKNCYKDLEDAKYTKEHGSSIQNNCNNVARVIKVISIITGIIGVIYGLSMLDYWRTQEYTLPIIIVSVVVSIFIYGFGEIIQLLEDIKNNKRR